MKVLYENQVNDLIYRKEELFKYLNFFEDDSIESKKIRINIQKINYLINSSIIKNIPNGNSIEEGSVFELITSNGTKLSQLVNDLCLDYTNSNFYGILIKSPLGIKLINKNQSTTFSFIDGTKTKNYQVGKILSRKEVLDIEKPKVLVLSNNIQKVA